LNKYSQTRVFSAARLVLLVGGGGAVWMLPVTAVPESRVETAAPGAALVATAHVNFKIIVPKVLYLQVGSSSDRAIGAETVAVMSNSHNATLNATVRTLEANAPARGNLILSAAGRSIIAQDAQCSLGAGRAPPARTASMAGPTAAQRVICTVSMP
jgi:hypothetical protein